MKRLFAAIVIVGVATLSLNADAQPDASAPEIIVTGVRPEQVQAFVEQVTATPPAADQLGLWDDDLCTTVAGLGAEQAQFVVDQISYRAEAVGLRAGGPGCNANVFVFFAADSDTFTPRLVEERRSLFAYYHEEHIITLGRDALEDFTRTSRPVRWWHVMQTRGADGHALNSSQAGTSGAGTPRDGGVVPDSDGFRGLQAVRSNGTRLRAPERQDFNRVVIIVDAQRAAGYPLESLADYVAFVTLAQIDANAETGDYPTILNMFDDSGEGALTLTTWDIAYLDGLYRSTRNAASTTQQVREISRRMRGEPEG